MATPVDLDAPIHVVRGSDDGLRNEAVVDLVTQLVGDGDRSMMVDEFAGADQDLVAAVSAAQTPAFLTPMRVVLVRHGAQFSKADDVAALVTYLTDPLETTSLVVVWETAPGQDRLAPIPKKLADAVKAAGGVTVSVDMGSTKKARDVWWDDHLANAPVRLDRHATTLLADYLGEDVAQLAGLLAKLAAAYGEGSQLGVEEVQPHLGKAGAVPPWDLTDAIDRGDTARALDLLHRMLDGGGRHPLAVMATLQGHYGKMLQLDGAGVRNEQQAAELLGMKGSTFPAKKALTQAQSLGHRGVARAVTLLAEADLTLRGGGVAWPGELVLDVLVARLSRLGGRRGATRPRGR